MSLLPVDAVQSPDDILLESRHEQALTQWDTQVAGGNHTTAEEDNTRATETDDDSTGQAWESPVPELEHQYSGSQKKTRRSTVTDRDREAEVGVKLEHINAV